MRIEDAEDEWPLRYSADQLAAFRWLLAGPGARDLATGATPQESRELAVSIALGVDELVDAGMVTLGPGDGDVSIEPPHALVFRACSEFDVQLTVRSTRPDRSDVFVFVMSHVLAEAEVGLELWLRDDGSTWINTWPYDELPVRLVEQMLLPPVRPDAAVPPPLSVPVSALVEERERPALDGVPAASALGRLVDEAQAYVTVDVLTAADEELGGGDLRYVVRDGALLLAERTAEDEVAFSPVTHRDLLSRVEQLLGGLARAE